MNKEIRILLIPEDFINTDFSDFNDCAATRAVKRHFNVEKATSCPLGATIYSDEGIETTYKIKNLFKYQDFQFIKVQYEKDPEMKNSKYYLTLIEE